MKILAVSDMVVDRLYSEHVAEKFRDVDIILGCGDLPYRYLEFLVTSLHAPLFFVPGNHDPQFDSRDPGSRAEGCDLLDQRVAQAKGLTLAGLGGSARYKPDHANQYSQTEMYFRFGLLIPKLLKQRLQTGKNLDIMIAHSPPRGIHDDKDPAHIGFLAFRDFIRLFKPRYFLHGHTTVYKENLVSPLTKFGTTTIININPYKLLEV